MAADGGLRKSFRDHLLPRGFDMMAVETRGVATGAPDTNYCKDGVEGWIEYKRMTDGRTAVRPAQIGWAERRLEHGGRVFVAARQNGELRLYPGDQLRDLQTRHWDDVRPILIETGGPAWWDWPAIEAALLTWYPDA